MIKTNRLFFGNSAAVAQWVARRISIVGDSGFPASSIGIGVLNDRGDDLIAGVVYSDYHPNHGTIQISMAADSPMWARPEIIQGLLGYGFEEWGANCFKVWATVARENDHGLKTFKSVGFKPEATLAHHLGEKKHAIILRMLKPDYERKYKDGL